MATAQSNGKAVLLTINDIYRIEGINDGSSGGLARVIALRKELQKTAPRVLLLHAGDFLSPSFLGRTYAGAQMIDIMNIMDGKPATGTHDPDMFVTFGNHELDDTHCRKNGPLADLVTASEFTWLASNLKFGACKNLAPLAGNRNIASSTIITNGGLRIGLYSLTMPQSRYAAIVSDPQTTSCTLVRSLRSKGVDAVVALTHLPWVEDLKLLRLGPDGRTDGRTKLQDQPDCTPDIVVGGHDHVSLALPSKSPRLFKADADAVSAWVIELEKSPTSALKVSSRLVILGPKRPRDALAQRLVENWLVRHDEQYCLKDCYKNDAANLKECLRSVANGACLKQQIARTNSDIETEELINRSMETGFGNWVADQMRQVGNTDVSFLNAGAIRLNYNLSAGTIITRRHLAQMFPFKNKIVVRDVPANSIWQAMEHAIAHRGEGPWAHFSGIAVRLGSSAGKQKVERILLRKRDGQTMEITARSKQKVRIASLSFVLANGDGHGFELCGADTSVSACKQQLEADPRWPLSGEDSDLTGFVRKMLSKQGLKPGLKIATDQRLCDPRQSNCLIDRWQNKN
jgi:2',3'-cyclic-nucleotide 2'-phosphodiesterase (5'-nucleotidase family)